MVSWRTVTGKIELLDPQLTSPAQIQEFFAAERLLGRGDFITADGDIDGAAEDAPRVFHFELAMAGRRRRVATLDEEGEVILGHTTTEVLESLSRSLRKVAIEIDGKTIHGPLDIGAVGVAEADLLMADLPNADAGDAPKPAAADAPADPANQENEIPPVADPQGAPLITGAQAPTMAAGPTLLVGDFPVSELPFLANSEDAKLLNFKLGSLQAITLGKSLQRTRRIFPRPELVIELSLGKSDFISPTLVVLRNSRRFVWEWKGELPCFSWFEDAEKGIRFVRDELGAGAIARAAVADIVDTSFEEVRQALLATPATGARKFAELLGVPVSALLFLGGNIDIATAHARIPNSRVFQPGSRHETFRQTIAWEVAGEGIVDSDLAGVYRWMYLKRPWLVSLVAAGQAAVGGALISAALLGGRKSKLVAGIGGVLILNAASRIVTTEYVQNAIARNNLHANDSSASS
ncbi:hypothetical protein [Arcanobacterium hippocoleae]|uniref:hypothetical protein n=1 Tax=Arcanobacterium hippocoleae TaxID=149017 RepID=UPI0033424B2C